MKWLLGLYDEKRPKSPSTDVPVPFVFNDGKALRGATLDTLTWIGQASFLVQLGGKSVLIDPVLSMSLGWIKRNGPPGLDWPALPKIDVVLITHDHRDHMDAPTLRKLGPDPLYVVPRGLGKWFHRNGMRRVVEMDWWQQETIEGLQITFVPAEHWSRRGLTDLNASWWGGYVIEHDGMRMYHSGDTGWFDGFSKIRERCGRIDAAMLPIGAYAPRWFMQPQHIDPEEAVRAFLLLEAEYFIAMHWGTFKLSDEPLDEPPLLLRDAWKRANLPDERLVIPAIGETLLLDRFRSE
jgi:L-ascorbate metabolism protein UlaG (beta-lactamase superfamily)